MVYHLTDRDLAFPSPRGDKHETGVIAIGGGPTPARLALAYSLGIFPWYQEDETPPLWHAPDQRMVLFPDHLRVNRSLRRSLNRGLYEVRYDTAFEEVLSHCAGVSRPNQDGTWLSPRLQHSLMALHHAGIAHSAEAWRDGALVGGLYGLTMGRVFFGESMFALAPDASKVTFVTLTRALVELDYALIDCQAHTDHLERLGATEMSGARFYSLLESLICEAPRAVWPTSVEGGSPPPS